MAVRQRILNSTAPFSGSPPVDLKGSYPKCTATEKGTQQQQEEEEEEEEEPWKSGKVDYIALTLSPLLNKVLTQGTAEQVGEAPLKSSAFIAQAECETQDSQEFSPSCSERPYVPSPSCFLVSLQPDHNNVACPTTASVQEPSCSPSTRRLGQRKKARKRTKRKGRKKQGGKEVEESYRYGVASGVPEQESGTSLEHILDESFQGRRSPFSSSCCSSVESCKEQDASPSLYSPKIFNTGSSCSPLSWTDFSSNAPHSLHSYGQESDSFSSAGDCSLALAGLRGSVSQGDPCYAGPFFKAVERDAWVEDGKEWPSQDSVSNEGIIFYNEKLQPVDSEYKEGREFVLSDFLKEGSYGEVHSARDVNTGFKFAVKKITLKRFNSEEVSTWSALRSLRVLKLFGVVRDGPYIFFLMDHKSGSLGQLILRRGRLPEDLSLYYLLQVGTALEYLAKKKVAHLDVKADNVLLSEDGRDCFLCDFGHAERLDTGGQSLSGSRDLKGTETHMAPEIVRGEPRGAKADVWSSCCMLLHMLNGCQPWTRYYTCRLFLKIANEPPPLREIPPHCGRLTVGIMKAGLQKDPSKRASASDMKERTARALQEVGGLRSPSSRSYAEPLHFAKKPPDSLPAVLSEGEERQEQTRRILQLDEEEEADVSKIPLFSQPGRKETTVPELELRKLERDFYLSSLSQLHSAEMQEQLLSCLSSDPYCNRKDSGRWSLNPADDFSSGVGSYGSQPDGQQQHLSLDLLGQSPPRPCCFQGVDVCIRDINGATIRIRETRRVKVGHIATGISDQISERVFTLETHLGHKVAHDDEVQESGLKLCCVTAPDYSAAWRWRIRDGMLETR
ncbi:mitogen-activated protein kinase kinase kinase 14 [Entelurus aequoreus]|uniref:mitogen-activated protein kinase kinase kinase 14 n=1 Tax=Entelurus aequoreus TaxID=161455 RepID=UPI002B1DCD05|nr:mitogen-activated protein kinase kinase kinase 14 [Entelurus aequoreus]XP_061906032.1 mitogen-activated protein kinase kinase kinase 14 [Entelurus aequoreus]XP_061906033.1 mitogen-activated protein kinase kinase kinase 14 [Entelurus aequoreus]